MYEMQRLFFGRPERPKVNQNKSGVYVSGSGNTGHVDMLYFEKYQFEIQYNIPF